MRTEVCSNAPSSALICVASRVFTAHTWLVTSRRPSRRTCKRASRSSSSSFSRLSGSWPACLQGCARRHRGPAKPGAALRTRRRSVPWRSSWVRRVHWLGCRRRRAQASASKSRAAVAVAVVVAPHDCRALGPWQTRRPSIWQSSLHSTGCTGRVTRCGALTHHHRPSSPFLYSYTGPGVVACGGPGGRSAHRAQCACIGRGQGEIAMHATAGPQG